MLEPLAERHVPFHALNGAAPDEVKLFHRLGLTDWALSTLFNENVLIVTADLQLARAIEIQRRTKWVINFNHLRDQ